MAVGILRRVLDRDEPALDRGPAYQPGSLSHSDDSYGSSYEGTPLGAGRGEGAWGDPSSSDPAHPPLRGADPNQRRSPGRSGPQSRAEAEHGRRLSSPSESGRLPLPEELGIVPEENAALPELTGDRFEADVLASPIPYLVDFWAETCVPCRLQEPAIRRLARELPGKLRVGRLNVFDHPDVPDRLRIKGVPHLVVFQAGEVVMEVVGSHSYEQLRDKLRRLGIE